ncbi:hypothetical protein CN918_26815 [Priestia megaterium]|nr:hypothetical protein CN918_26815 [Priestia megaterium]
MCYPANTQVQTNKKYFDTFGRRVKGTVIAPEGTPLKEAPKGVTLVKWEVQEGKSIPAHQDTIVMMMTRDLELQHSH